MLNFQVLATEGTARKFEENNIPCERIKKIKEGHPNLIDHMKNHQVAMIINTTDERRASIQDSYSIRRSALQARITYYTTLSGARAACAGSPARSSGCRC